MPDLHFRLPGIERSLAEWLRWLFPAADRQALRSAVEASRVRVDGRDWRGGRGRPCPPGVEVRLEGWPDDLPRSRTTGAADCGSGWIALPVGFGGRLGASGTEPADAARIDFEIVAAERGLARLAFELEAPATAESMVRRFAAAGLPFVGDLEGGGIARPADDGPALILGDAPLSWPLPEPVPAWMEAGSDGCLPAMRVSRAAARILRRGHPWLRPDAESDPVAPRAPGSLTPLQDPNGRAVGFAWIEEPGPIAARIAAVAVQSTREVPSIEGRVARALGRRRALLARGHSEGTDCQRLIHAEADALPALFVDRIGPLLRVLVSGRAAEGFVDRAIAALRAQLPVLPEGAPWSVLELRHARAGTGQASFRRSRWRVGGPDALAEAGAELWADGLVAREAGLRFRVDPGWHDPWRTRPGFGLFADQRENRARLAERARSRGGRWLNLFAHTGAFSVALLAAGAEEVVSVDLSAPYLDRLEENLTENTARGVDPARHVRVRGDGRRYLETLEAGVRFDGIVLDPPTAAAAGRRFWSVAQDLEPLLERAVARLADGGALLVTQNQRGAPLGLERLLDRLAHAARRPVGRLEAAPPAGDFPTLEGFPEGDPFEGAWLELD